MVSIANDFVINGVHCVEVFSVFGVMHNRFEVIVRIPTLTRAYVISGSRYVLWLPGGINTIQMDVYVWSFPSGWGVVLVASIWSLLLVVHSKGMAKFVREVSDIGLGFAPSHVDLVGSTRPWVANICATTLLVIDAHLKNGWFCGLLVAHTHL